MQRYGADVSSRRRHGLSSLGVEVKVVADSIIYYWESLGADVQRTGVADLLASSYCETGNRIFFFRYARRDRVTRTSHYTLVREGQSKKKEKGVCDIAFC